MPVTMNEFVMYTKGWEYVIAIGFILSFIVFWGVMNRDRTS
ncbi:MAG: hypothetical protein ACYC3S_13135 [Chloroflexota bacterium]